MKKTPTKEHQDIADKASELSTKIQQAVSHLLVGEDCKVINIAFAGVMARAVQATAPPVSHMQVLQANFRLASKLLENDIKPRDIITRQSIENAMIVIMATGGSTNAVLHFIAIARAEIGRAHV